ncbi:lipoate-protein ligase A [Gelidibacter algens]|jgi:lipoate-protein ligase A|uniref:lipoate--protein ligase n=1 Tax=Gelidibacter algens TaxID=49280 RepID=A0A1A7QZ99_9FLAO|nr:lipoate--protein ligase [Gelidibacter algens]OBX25340.1 lipoate--protein ligase [Gelidibacter algens]RAJ25195.1 lipoate-protein ligase A [Gelidibacter algens]
MIFIENEGQTNPKLNLALEEYILRNFSADNDYLLFYINEPSIIIGRNQNTLEEINQNYVEEKKIHIVRRVSGGGAVYHDFGNLNFSFITDHDGKSLNNFKKFTAPVIKVLNNLGLNAELKGRNDIQVDDKKISGTAQFSTGKRMVSHGTLLLDTDLGEVVNALNVKMSKIQSKGHKSVRSRVANISEFLKEPLKIEEFRQLVLEGLYEESEPFETYHLSDAEWQGVHQLKTEKYENWDWNYGRSPKFNIQRSKRFPVGEIDLRIFVEKGYIKDFKIFGDFFGKEPVERIEQLLTDERYERTTVSEVLKNVELSDYFGEISEEDFIDLIYGDDE